MSTRTMLSFGLSSRVPAALTSAALGLVLACGLAVAPAQVATAEPDAVKEAQKKVNALHEQSSQLELEHNKLVEKLAAADKKVVRLQKDVTAQRTKVSSMRKSLRGVAQAQFQNSRMGLSAQLVTAKDETSMLRTMATVHATTLRTTTRLQTLQSEQGRLTTLEKQLTDSRDGIKADKEKKSDLLAQYTKKSEEAEKVLSKLTAAEKKRLEKLQAEQAARQLAAQRAREERAAATSRASTATEDTSTAATDKKQDKKKPNATSTPAKPTAEKSTPKMPASSSGAAAAVAYARAQVGKAYVTGAEGPSAFDCSGLTSAAWARAGVSLPRTSQAQAGVGVPVSLSNIQPGDLVIFYSSASHVGIYVGGGMLVDAANPRKGVRLISLQNSWMPIQSIRRVG